MPPIETPLGGESLVPVQAGDRFFSVDVLRGFALLGILLMNAQSFALPMGGWIPTISGGSNGANWALWFIQQVFWNGKMRAIFSMMFGAGIILLTERASKREGGAEVADIWIRRVLWMIAFGMAHAYFVWGGDILFYYGLMGLVLFPFRKLSARTMLIVAALQILVLTGMDVRNGIKMQSNRAKAQTAEAAEKRGEKLTDELKAAKEEWSQVQKSFNPTPEDLKKEVGIYGGGYLGILKHRATRMYKAHSVPIYDLDQMDWMAMMLIGMALYKLGVLTLQRSSRFYGWLAIVGALVAIPTNLIATLFWWRHISDPVMATWTWAPQEIGRASMALSYTGLLMMVVKGGYLRPLTSRLAAVGQMALTNYITHSLVFSTLFYGYGFGLYNHLQRYQIHFVIVALWAFQLAVSPIWLRHFQFGPLEWCWRSLTYWKRQPMRLRATQPDLPLVLVTEVDS